MSLRFFHDDAGAEWQVWDACTELRGPVAPEFAAGWLCFERVDPEPGALDAAPERRRLAPIPPAWDTLADADLVGLLARASMVPRRPPPPPAGPAGPAGRVRVRPR